MNHALNAGRLLGILIICTVVLGGLNYVDATVFSKTAQPAEMIHMD